MTDVWLLDGENALQFGAVRAYPRTASVGDLVEKAGKWVLDSVNIVCREIGIDVSVALQTLAIVYDEGVEDAGMASHSDPLRQSRARRLAPAVYPTVTVGWKFMIIWVGDPPQHPNILTEGIPPVIEEVK